MHVQDTPLRYLPNVPGVIEALGPELRNEVGASESRELCELAHGIAQLPAALHAQLVARCESPDTERSSVTVCSLVLAQYHLLREEPSRALKWNRRAKTSLNGLSESRLAPAAIASQRLAGELQSVNLKAAKEAEHELSEYELSDRYEILVRHPLRELRILTALESGRYGYEGELREILAEEPHWVKAFHEARFALQAARYAKARELLESAKADLPAELQVGAVSRFLDLQIARCQIGLAELGSAEEKLSELVRYFAMLPMRRARLSAEFHLVEAKRHADPYGQEEALLAILKAARHHGLRREAFDALVALAFLDASNGKLEEARARFDESRALLDPDLQKKNLCTVNRRESQAEFRAGHPDRGAACRKQALDLLAPEAEEERALLAANLGQAEVLYLIRQGEIEQARDLAQSHLSEIRSIVTGESRSYGAEVYPKLYAVVLWLTTAYCEIRLRKPKAALQATAAARAARQSIPELSRHPSRLAFLECLAHAQLGQPERSLAALEELIRDSQAPDPISAEAGWWKERDHPAVVDRLCFELYCALRRSEVAARFEPLRKPLALAISPTPMVPFDRLAAGDAPPPAGDRGAETLAVYEKAVAMRHLAEIGVPAEKRERVLALTEEYGTPRGESPLVSSAHLQRTWARACRLLEQASGRDVPPIDPV